MARALVERTLRKDAELASRYAAVPREKLVYWALPKAMKSIGPPADGSTRGTWLAARGSFEEDKEPPTFEQRQRVFGDLARYSENRYKGYYHTNETIPTVYFDEGLWRREDLVERDDLLFTYLHSENDPDYACMGLGEESDAAEKRRDSAPQEKGATP
jgi:hypothetical protein